MAHASKDGLLPFDGMAPALLEWSGNADPCDALTASYVRLDVLKAAHPAPPSEHLTAFRAVRYESGVPALRALFQAPEGERQL